MQKIAGVATHQKAKRTYTDKCLRKCSSEPLEPFAVMSVRKTERMQVDVEGR